MIFLQLDRDDLQSEWRKLMVLGFLLIAAGEVALYSITLGFTTAGAATAAGPLGLVLLVTGALLMYAPLRRTAWGDRHLQAFAAAVHLAAGAWLISSPSSRAAAVMPLLGACFVGGGAFQIYAAVTLQRFQWGWAVLSGSVFALLGVLMVLEWPAGGIVSLGRIVGFALMVGGTTLLGLAWQGWRSGRGVRAKAGPEDSYN